MDERTTDMPSLQYILYKGATGSRSQPIYELTVPTQPMM